MKIYTEEQVYDAISKAFRYKSNIEVLNSLTPIELPTDEEVEKTAKEKHVGISRDVANCRGCFEQGAKWMKEQILKQNK